MDLIIFLRMITSSVAVIMLIYLGIDVLPVMTYEPGGGDLSYFFKNDDIFLWASLC